MYMYKYMLMPLPNVQLCAEAPPPQPLQKKIKTLLYVLFHQIQKAPHCTYTKDLCWSSPLKKTTQQQQQQQQQQQKKKTDAKHLTCISPDLWVSLSSDTQYFLAFDLQLTL